MQREWLIKAGAINAAIKSGEKWGECLMAHYTYSVSTFIIPERYIQFDSVREESIG